MIVGVISLSNLAQFVSLIGQWGPHIPSLSKPSCLWRRGEMGPSFLWGISKERNLFLEELVEYRIIFTYIHQLSICVKCSNFLENLQTR